MVPLSLVNSANLSVLFKSPWSEEKRWMGKSLAFSAHCPTRESCRNLRKGRNDQENRTNTRKKERKSKHAKISSNNERNHDSAKDGKPS